MLELRHLRYFIAVGDDLNFRRAAERIHVDQTALSRAIRHLEVELDVPLFVRLPRRLQLTPAGEILLQECRELFVRMERAKRRVRHTHAFYQAPLRIGVADGIAQPKLSECLAGWSRVAPEIPLDILEMRARELASALRHEEVDVGFSFGVPDDDTIVQKPAWRYRLKAILPRRHELAVRSELSMAELLAFPLLSCSAERLPGLLAQMRAVVRAHATQITIAECAYTLSGYVTRIGAGAGVGLGDAGHACAMQRDDVVALPLTEEAHITTFVLYKRQSPGIAEPIQRFLAHVRTLS